MTMSTEFKDHLLDLLAPLGPVQARRMFGGGGLFLDGAMFALVTDELAAWRRGAWEAAKTKTSHTGRGGA